MSYEEEYAAFAAKDRVKRLRIRSVNQPTHAPGYHLLQNLVYDEQGTHVVLVYSILKVLVRGRSLRRMIFAIENDMANFIQEFDAGRWPQPGADVPFISSIEVKEHEHSAKPDDEKPAQSQFAFLHPARLNQP